MGKYARIPLFETRDGLPVLPRVPDRQYHHEGLQTKLARVGYAIVVVVVVLMTAVAVPWWLVLRAAELLAD